MIVYSVEVLSFGTTATYTCSPGFSLSGSQRRMCIGNGDSSVGMFNGTNPFCQRKFLFASIHGNLERSFSLLFIEFDMIF